MLACTLNESRPLVGALLRPHDGVHIELRSRVLVRLPSFRISFFIWKGPVLVTTLHDAQAPSDVEAGDYASTIDIPAYFLSPGEYMVDVPNFRLVPLEVG